MLKYFPDILNDFGLSDKFSFRRYIICWGNLSLSKITGGGGGGTPYRRILLFCKIVYILVIW